jgi:hypothetical protein
MLERIAERSFIVVQAAWSAQQCRRVIEGLASQPEFLIVRRDETPARYHLVSLSPPVLRTLGAAAPTSSTGYALGLVDRPPTSVMDAWEDARKRPPRDVIVVDGERIVGYVRATLGARPIDSGSTWPGTPPIAPPPPHGGPVLPSPGGLTRGGGAGSGGVTRGGGVGHGGTTRGGGSGGLEGMPQTVERSIGAQCPKQVVVGQETPLSVFLSSDTAAGGLVGTFSVGDAIDIEVAAKRGCEIVGPRSCSLYVRAGSQQTEWTFKFRAIEEGAVAVRVSVQSGGTPLGAWIVETEAIPGDAVGAAGAVGTVTVPITVPTMSVSSPDLTLSIIRETVSELPRYTFLLRASDDTAAAPGGVHPPAVQLDQDPRGYFATVFKEIEAAALADVTGILENCGDTLTKQLLPEPVIEALWRHRDRIASVQIVCDDPWIPWELCRLRGYDDGGRVVTGPFLSEAFAVTRWLPDVQAKPSLDLSRIALVVPADSKLPSAAAEQGYLNGLAGAARQVVAVDAEPAAVIAAMAGGQYGGWHFTGHGVHDPSAGGGLSALELEAGDTLTPQQVSGSAENLGTARPLVFLNACQTGQAERALAGPGGWAQCFLKAAYAERFPQNGAAAFIGTFWSIDDASGFAFAKAFYDALLHDGQTIGLAVHAARQAIRKPDDPSWLAYTVFAHPMAKVVGA